MLSLRLAAPVVVQLYQTAPVICGHVLLA